MIVNKNEYALTFADGTPQVVLGSDMKQITENFESTVNPLTQITRQRIGVRDIVPDPVVLVEFEVEVTDPSAASAGCVGSPSAYEVPAGTSVIFEATPVVGFEFVGWYVNGASTAISTDAIATIQIDQPSVAGAVVEIEARFAALST